MGRRSVLGENGPTYVTGGWTRGTEVETGEEGQIRVYVVRVGDVVSTVCQNCLNDNFEFDLVRCGVKFWEVIER